MSNRAPRRHSAAQRLVLILNSVLVTACLVGAGALVVSQQLLGDRQQTGELVNLANAESQAPNIGPTETFPKADPTAKNFLITGSDNNACIDPSSPYAGAFGDRSTLGERSDTIMVMRVDPSTSQAAVLSFPRDLWVTIAGTDTESRINSAYVKGDPSKLIQTIYDNFGIGIDHFIQVDFCAFKTLVDAVGGVPVPFSYPARDDNTGLDVPTPGCFTFSGDAALAYVRSRHYEYLDPTTNVWKEDPAADLGRISRQQDFLRRVIAKALSTGVYTPSVASGLIETARKYVVTDPSFTINRMLQFAGVIQNLNPAGLRSYQVVVRPEKISGNAVLIPRLGGDNMKAILELFRGRTPLVAAPEQTQVITDTSAVAVPSDGVVTTTTVLPVPTLAPTSDPAVPVVTAVTNDQGIFPPKDVSC
ncbi:MAG: LCP family protein [Ilumatobacteraceae bacterium]